MRKFFILTALLMVVLTTTAFAAKKSVDPENAPYIYTSQDFKFSIACPIKPLAVVQNPWEEPEKRGEMLVFANEGFDVQYAYIIQVDAFTNDKVPDFNSKAIKGIGDYLLELKKNGGFATADLVNLTKTNKGVMAVTPDKIEVLNKETGEVEGELIADHQYIYTFFRTPAGRCISIQLISANLQDKQYIDTYKYSVASFKDVDEKSNKKDKKKDKKDKKDKQDKKSKKSNDK